METAAVNKIKLSFSQGISACITLLCTTVFGHGSGVSDKQAIAKIFSKQTGDVIELSLNDLQQLIDKVDRAQYDGNIRAHEWSSPTSTIVSYHETKLFAYECGTFFSVQQKNKQVKIDLDIVEKLRRIEKKFKNFIDCDEKA